jgi:ATP-binding cassette subfamily B protein
MIADKLNTLQMGVVSGERILKLLNEPQYVQASGSFRFDEQMRGDVKFENVIFGYNDSTPVLKNVSFDILKGQVLAIVGATGAGKSSIINLLNRFYEYQSGRICIDNVELKDFELAYLRKHIAVVMQDVFLFSDSILNNISLWDDSISREKVISTAQLLGADKFIEKLPGGYDYNVMERGATLSVGQRQLISFVRAMVHDPKILILDEATSSIDDESEQMIQQAIAKMMVGRTSIVIAHRLSTIKAASKIMVLDRGEIKEIGDHAQLLALDGFYANLYRMQYKESPLVN